jgi:hypothetical protein
MVEEMVRMLAEAEDLSNAIQLGWVDGDDSAYVQWRDQFEVESAGAFRAEPGKEVAVSHYGGGAAATYWYVDGSDIVGVPNTVNFIWRIPLNDLSGMPKVIKA